MTIQIESAEGHDGPAEFFDAAVERSARFDSQRAGIVDQWDGRGKQVRAGHIYGQGRSGQDALPNLGGCRTSTHRSGRLLGGVHWMAGSQLGAFLSPLESPARVSAFGRKCVRLCLLQYGCGRVGTARTPPLSILCRLVPSKRRNAQKKGQRMTLETFREPGLLYLVHVEDATKDAKDNLKPDALIYSRVTEILKVERK